MITVHLCESAVKMISDVNGFFGDAVIMGKEIL